MFKTELIPKQTYHSSLSQVMAFFFGGVGEQQEIYHFYELNFLKLEYFKGFCYIYYHIWCKFIMCLFLQN